MFCLQGYHGFRKHNITVVKKIPWLHNIFFDSQKMSAGVQDEPLITAKLVWSALANLEPFCVIAH